MSDIPGWSVPRGGPAQDLSTWGRLCSPAGFTWNTGRAKLPGPAALRARAPQAPSRLRLRRCPRPRATPTWPPEPAVPDSTGCTTLALTHRPVNEARPEEQLAPGRTGTAARNPTVHTPPSPPSRGTTARRRWPQSVDLPDSRPGAGTRASRTTRQFHVKPVDARAPGVPVRFPPVAQHGVSIGVVESRSYLALASGRLYRAAYPVGRARHELTRTRCADPRSSSSAGAGLTAEIAVRVPITVVSRETTERISGLLTRAREAASASPE